METEVKVVQIGTNEGTIKSIPWKDGYYRLTGMTTNVFVVDGEKVHVEDVTNQGSDDDPMSNGTWKFGDFGDAPSEVAKYTGKQNSDVDISMWGGVWSTKGVICDEGRRIAVWSITNELAFFEKISDEEYNEFMSSADSATAPSSSYKIQPEFQGKLLWVSGAPGLGKSTSGLYLARTKGYVYYEADAFGGNANPYIPLDAEEPSLATMKQKPLKDIPKERLDAVKNGTSEFLKLIGGGEYDYQKIAEYYSVLCKDIQKERLRIGGNWVVAQAIPLKSFRDHIRQELGPDLIFVVLHMSKEEQTERLVGRHGEAGRAFIGKLTALAEPEASAEENAINVTVTSTMSRKDVVEKILEMLPDDSM